MKDNPFFLHPQLDSQVYDEWGLKIAQGDWLGGDKAFFISPLYAYYLALLYTVFGQKYFVVKVVQIFLASLIWVVVWLIGKKLFNERAGTIAALMGCFYSYSIFIDGELLKHSFAALTTIITIYVTMEAKERRSSLLFYLSGLCLGLSVINQPNLLLLLPFFAIWAVNWREKNISILIKPAFFVLGAICIIIPVTVRNYIVERDFVLISSNGGVIFFLGYNKNADGGIGNNGLIELNPLTEETQIRNIPNKFFGRNLKSSEMSAYWFSLGERYIYENPGTALKLTFKKMLLFFNWYEIPDNTDYYFIKRFSGLLRLPLISFGFLAPLAIVGITLSFKNWREHALNYAIIITFMLSLAAFTVIGRYRFTIIPLLSIYAGFAADTTYCAFKKKKYSLIALIMTLFLVFAVVSNLKILGYQPQASQKLLGDIYKKLGQCEKATSEYKEVLQVIPFNKSLMTNYAYCLKETGHKDEALDMYRQVLQHYSAQSEGKVDLHLVIASLLADKGDRKGAEDAYEKALKLDGYNIEALNNLAYLYLLDMRLSEAKNLIKQAIQIKPDSAECLDTFGLILTKEKKHIEAMQLFEKAVSLKPESDEIRRHFNDAMTALKRTSI